jgi:membrane fusion protein (multidrug efflux system)
MHSNAEPNPSAEPTTSPKVGAAVNSDSGVRRPRTRLLALGAALAVAVYLGVNWMIRIQAYEETDDAYVTGHCHPLSFRVSGVVSEILVDDNQYVKAGQLIARLDSKDYELRLQKAKAEFEAAKAQLLQGEARLNQAIAELNQAEAQRGAAKAKLDNSERILQRNNQLFYEGKKVISRQELDNAQFQYEGDRATYDSLEAAVRVAKAGVETAKAQHLAVVAQVDASRAALENTELQVRYTAMYAPVDGRIAEKSVETGEHVQPGQRLMAIVEPDVWIVANYKETQLGRIRLHQDVEIAIDAVKGAKFKGKVTSLQAGTGAAFAFLPSDNATGNFTKIVQRVPVKIIFDAESIGSYKDRIVPGLSAVSVIKVK